MGGNAIRLSDSMADRGYTLDGEDRIVHSGDLTAPFARLAETEGWTFWDSDNASRPYLMTEVSAVDGSVLFFDDSTVARQELARFTEATARGSAVPDYASARFDALYVRLARERIELAREDERRALPCAIASCDEVFCEIADEPSLLYEGTSEDYQLQAESVVDLDVELLAADGQTLWSDRYMGVCMLPAGMPGDCVVSLLDAAGSRTRVGFFDSRWVDEDGLLGEDLFLERVGRMLVCDSAGLDGLAQCGYDLSQASAAACAALATDRAPSCQVAER